MRLEKATNARALAGLNRPAGADNIGIVMPGGGANGAFSAWAANTLADAGYTFGAVSGISVGALNGAMISTGRLNRLIEMWEKVEHDDIYGREWLPMRIARILLGHRLGLYHTDGLRDLLREMYDPRATEIPFVFGVFDANSRRYETTRVLPGDGSDLWVQAVRDGVRASACVPGYAQPIRRKVKHGDTSRVHHWLDGGVINVAPLAEMFDLESGEYPIDRILVLAPGRVPTRPEARRRGGGYTKTGHILDIGGQVLKAATGETIYNDIERALAINELVRQAADEGFVLTNRPGGRILQYIPVDIIQPSEGLGAGTDFSEGAYAKRKNDGIAQAEAFIDRDRPAMAA